MKNLSYYSKILAAAAILSALSCARTVETDSPAEEVAENISFKTILSPSAVFQTGISDAGLFIGEPVNVSNVRLAIDKSGKVTPETPVKWAPGQTLNSDFLAYSPYDGSYSERTEVRFSVQPDQSSEAGLTASDLLVAKALAKPSDGPVSLEFIHKLSQIRVYFDNRTGLDIARVEILNIESSVTLDLNSGKVAPCSGTSVIRAFAESNPSCYKVIVPPGSHNLNIRITLSDGSILDRKAGKVSLDPGKYYDNASEPILLEEGVKVQPVTLNFAVSDWVDGGQLDFNRGGYDSLADIASTATTTETAFSANVKDMVVTYVYPTGNKAFVEDLTGGMTVYCDCRSLSGSYTGTIRGTVSLYQGYAEFESLDVTGASNTTDVTIPETELTLSELMASYNRYIGCRICLKDVEVTKGFTSGTSAQRTGEISVYGEKIQIYNDSNNATVSTGFTGDLVAYPALYGGKKQLLVCESSWFRCDSGIADAFAKNNRVPGFYSGAAGVFSPVCVMSDADQVCCGSRGSYMVFSVVNPLNGYSVFCRLDTVGLSEGKDVPARISTIGTSALPSGDCSFVVVKVDNGTCWLLNPEGSVGLVVNI